MKSIEINRFKIDYSAEILGNQLTLYWTWHGPGQRTIEVKAKDLAFGCNETSVLPVNAEPGLRYWSCLGKPMSHGHSTDCNYGLGFKVEFRCTESGELLHSADFPLCLTDFGKRSYSGLFSVERPNFWVIGDSGASSFLYDSEPKDTEHGEWIINHVTYPSLSARRFARGNWRDFLKTIPLRKGDALAFMLGAWDVRAVCGHAKLKGVEPDQIIEETCFRYCQTLQEIELIYPDNPVIAIAPNPPAKIANINQEFINVKGSDEQRLEIWKLLNQRLEEAHARGQIKRYWNTTLYYKDPDGFMRPELLWPKDTHIKLGKPVLKAIKLLIDCHLVKISKPGSNK